MVPCLARSAVIIKCRNTTSVLLSNYELAYALGLMCRLGGFQIPEYTSMGELLEKLKQFILEYETEEAYIQNLRNMILQYIPGEVYDGQMKELFTMGTGEEHMWDEKI